MTVLSIIGIVGFVGSELFALLPAKVLKHNSWLEVVKAVFSKLSELKR